LIATLDEGDCFGEIALLVENERRTATVEAATFLDVFVLNKSDLEYVLLSYPQQRQLLQEMAEIRKSKVRLMVVN
jgi:CRP-like cAMP-binding protein